MYPASLRPNGRNEELSLIHTYKHYNQNKDKILTEVQCDFKITINLINKNYIMIIIILGVSGWVWVRCD